MLFPNPEIHTIPRKHLIACKYMSNSCFELLLTPDLEVHLLLLTLLIHLFIWGLLVFICITLSHPSHLETYYSCFSFTVHWIYLRTT